MPMIRPGSSSIPDLEDFEPYTVRLKSLRYGDPHPEYGQSLVFEWYLDDPDETLRSFAPPKLGQNRQTGQVSKLRAILNAMFGYPEQTVITGLNDETWQVHYADGVRQIELDMPVVVRGKNVIKPDGAKRYQIQTYQPVRPVRGAQPPGVPTPTTVPPGAGGRPPVDPGINPDDIPF